MISYNPAVCCHLSPVTSSCPSLRIGCILAPLRIPLKTGVRMLGSKIVQPNILTPRCSQPGPQTVDGTVDPFPAVVYGVAGGHRRRRIAVPKEFLNHAEVIIIVQRVCDEGVPQRVSVGRPLTPSTLAMWPQCNYHNRRCVIGAPPGSCALFTRLSVEPH
jgi:hypothetical protein